MTRRSPAPWYAGPPENGFVRGKRYRDDQLYAGLAITPSSLEDYRSLFLEDRLPNRYAARKDGWPMVRHRWADHHVLRHFAGLITVGLYWAEFVQTLMLDFDKHGDRTRDEMRDTVRVVLRSIPGEWLVYHSSQSGGIRAISFLDQPISRVSAQNWLVAQLKAAGLGHLPGIVEARMIGSPDRLPFGCGSPLVDPITLDPIFDLSLAQTITHSADFRNLNRIATREIIDANRERAASASDPNEEWGYRSRRLLADGLYPEIETNQAIRDLMFYYRVCKRQNQAEAVASIREWIRGNHNRLSNKYNAGRIDLIDKLIEKTGHCFDPSKVNWERTGHASRSAPPEPLTRADLVELLCYPLDYKGLVAAWHLLAWCRGNLRYTREKTKKNSKPYVPRICEQNGHITYVPRFSWNQYAEIPVVLLEALPGFPKSNTRPMMEHFCAVRLFEIRKDYHLDSHSCRHYWVRFTYADTGSQVVPSLEAGFLEHLGEGGLRQRFSPHYVKVIIDKAQKQREKDEAARSIVNNLPTFKDSLRISSGGENGQAGKTSEIYVYNPFGSAEAEKGG